MWTNLITSNYSSYKMWTNLPFDLLSKIFSYLPPDSLARAKTTSRSWHNAAETVAASASSHRHPPWFLAFPTRIRINSCYAHNPITQNWHTLPLDQITSPIKPISTINGLVLLKLTATTSLQLALLNPFTKQFKFLPKLNIPRTNPAVGIVKLEQNLTQNVTNFGFKIYVAGGMMSRAEGSNVGAMYQPSVEMYESTRDTWKIIGAMPVEFAVRLTVWTPNESVYSKGVLYWMTCARAYSVMGFEIGSNTPKWREFSVPMGDKLEFAALVLRNGNLTLFGGICGGDLCVWELGDNDVWSLVEKLPIELGIRVLGSKLNWGSVKCVGIDGAICLYTDLGSGFVVWREVFGEWKWPKWDWVWVDGFCSVKISNLEIRGLLLHPNLLHSTYLI